MNVLNVSHLAGNTMGAELSKPKRRLDSPQQRHDIQVFNAPPAEQHQGNTYNQMHLI